jgi:hypothetical protein
MLAAVPEVRTHAQKGIADNWWLCLDFQRLKNSVDDAAVLHVLAEQAEPFPGCFPP